MPDATPPLLLAPLATGHLPMLEAPGELAATIGRFIATVPSAG
ncbi:MAG: hypothetical protein AB7G37_05470 [Solirubrobacteraceae bacterium]